MDFHNRFKNHSNSELLNIIKNPNDFQPLAVETAKTIFASRQLDAEEIQIAEAELSKQQMEMNVQNEKKKALEIKIKNIGSSLADTFNPIQTTTPTTDKIIKIISVVFGGLFIYQFYNEFSMIKFMFTNSNAKWDFSMLLYFLPLIIIPTAAVLFYTRKKIGWTLLAIFLSSSAVNAILLFIVEINRKPFGIPALDNLFPTTSPITHIGTIFFFTGTLGVICKTNIREIYKVEKKSMIATIGLTSTIVCLFIYSFF